jgi:hypothetical protein
MNKYLLLFFYLCEISFQSNIIHFCIICTKIAWKMYRQMMNRTKPYYSEIDK